MKHAWRVSVAAVLLILRLMPPAANAEAQKRPADAPLRVLIVSAMKGSGYAGGISGLLEEHGVSATVLGWPSATAERAREFDLVIVVGVPRRTMRSTDLSAAVFGYERPVLGYGSYGCDYFGRLRLKNGAPYT